MRSQRVLRPIQSIEEVQASIDTFGDRIVEKLDGRTPSLPAEGDTASATFSYQGVFDELGRDLTSLRLKVVEAEDEHVRRQALTAATGRQTEELGTELYDQQVAARRILGGAFTPGRGFELAAVTGITPRNFKALAEQVDQTVKLLRQPVVEKPTVKIAGVTIDFDTVADGLETELQKFRVKRAELGRARKGSGESKVLLDETLEECQGAFPWIAQVLEGFARMADERELADRIRTSIRRVTRRQSAAGGGSSRPASAGQAAGEEPSGEAPSNETSPETPEPSTTTPDETAPPDGGDPEPSGAADIASPSSSES